MKAKTFLFIIFCFLFSACGQKAETNSESRCDTYIGVWTYYNGYGINKLTISKDGQNYLVIHDLKINEKEKISSTCEDGSLVEIEGGRTINYIDSKNVLLFENNKYNREISNE